MKIFNIYEEDYLDDWLYSFHCERTNCEICNYKFLCYTNGAVINIVDSKLISKLTNIGMKYSNEKQKQAARRKLFFRQ